MPNGPTTLCKSFYQDKQRVMLCSSTHVIFRASANGHLPCVGNSLDTSLDFWNSIAFCMNIKVPSKVSFSSWKILTHGNLIKMAAEYIPPFQYSMKWRFLLVYKDVLQSHGCLIWIFSAYTSTHYPVWRKTNFRQ